MQRRRSVGAGVRCLVFRDRFMNETELRIARFEASQLDALLELTLRAWAPVFPLMEADIPPYVYRAFYPEGWEARQRNDVAAICRDENTEMWVALIDAQLAGYVGLRAHEADSMGEVHILAVDPAFQRRGVGRALLDFSFDWIRQRGLSMAFVETGGDRGHAPSRAIYESAGFERYPVARYFRPV
jgi:GNAT superfamily N-acetyltransferase